MKKIISVALAVCMAALIMVGCAQQPVPKVVQIKIAALNGPTGMGITPLMEQKYSARYKISLSGAPDDITGKLISGEIDMAAVPVNLAAVLYNKTQGGVLMTAVNTLGVLYILENGQEIHSIKDLAGKTIYASGQGSTPEYVLNYLLSKNGIAGSVKIVYLSDHAELATRMASGEIKLAMLPEPNVTAVVSKNKDVRIALDLTKEWDKVCDTQLVQGVIVVRKEFYEQNKDAVKKILEDYKTSTDFVNKYPNEASQLIAKQKIMASADLALQALPNCNIVCMTGSDMQNEASGMIKVLFNADPKSVGGTLPGNDFYLTVK